MGVAIDEQRLHSQGLPTRTVGPRVVRVLRLLNKCLPGEQMRGASVAAVFSPAVSWFLRLRHSVAAQARHKPTSLRRQTGTGSAVERGRGMLWYGLFKE